MEFAPIEWRRIHSTELVMEAGCWERCRSDYCCSYQHPDFNFLILRSGQIPIIYVDDEYEQLRSHDNAPTQGVVETLFDFGGGFPLRFTRVICGEQGQCKGKYIRPLLCRLYPFLPVIDGDAQVEDVIPVSVFDLAMEYAGSTSPCLVSARRDAYLSRWSQRGALRELGLDQPRLRLYMHAAKHFADLYRSAMAASPALQGVSGPAFWRQWERAYLTGQLVDVAQLRERIYRSYRSLCSR